jgi:hypothetical protein
LEKKTAIISYDYNKEIESPNTPLGEIFNVSLERFQELMKDLFASKKDSLSSWVVKGLEEGKLTGNDLLMFATSGLSMIMQLYSEEQKIENPGGLGFLNN